MRLFGGDFETDNSGVNKAWLVQACFYDGKKYYDFTSLAEVETFFINLLNAGDSRIYFHNARYDTGFLFKLFDSLSSKGYILEYITKMNNPIVITITYNKKVLEICDSSKKMPGDLQALGKTVGLDKLEGFDVSKSGWSKYIDLKDIKNWEYVHRDTEIVYVAMKHLHDSGLTGLTYSSDTFKLAKENLFPNPIYRRRDWSTVYPVIDYNLDQMFRLGYMGGINISQHKGKNDYNIKHIDAVSMYPSVMLYDKLPYGIPNKLNKGIEPQQGQLYIVKGWFKLKLKPEAKGLGWYMFRKAEDYYNERLMPFTPVENTIMFHEMVLTSVDLKNLESWYYVEELEDMPCEYWVFNGTIGRHTSYIMQQAELKAKAKKGSIERESAKLMMNSLYGKFGSNPKISTTSLVQENGVYRYKEASSVSQNPTGYVPLAMFTTSHAHRRLLKTMREVGCENVIHCDTDSVIFSNRSGYDSVDIGDDLGKWKLEQNDNKKDPLVIYEGGFKRYVELFEDEITSMSDIKVTCAGVPKKMTLAGVPKGMWIELLDNPELICTNNELGKEEYKIESTWLRDLYTKHGMDPNKVNTMKLVPEHVDGGIILRQTTFKLRDIKKMGSGRW